MDRSTGDLDATAVRAVAARDLSVAVAMVLVTLAVVGVVSVAAVIISALFGTGDGGFVRWWAWPIADACDNVAFVEASLLFVAGLAGRQDRRR